jgi:hypothetical protein
MFVFWIITAIIICFGFVVFWGAPYVPTRRKQVSQAFDELYQVKPGDVVVDVGSGDGIMLRAAVKRGARAVGYELNPLLVFITKLLSRKEAFNMTVVCANFWRQTLPPETTLVYTFLEKRDIAKMELYLVRQARLRKKPLHFISYGFELPNTKPIKRVGPMLLYVFKSRKDATPVGSL